MAPILQNKQQSNQQGNAMQAQDIPLTGAPQDNAAGNLEGIAGQTYYEKNGRQYEMVQDGYFPPTDDVDWASKAMKKKENSAANTQQNEQESDEDDVQIIESSVGQAGRNFNAQGNLKGAAVENAEGNFQGAAAMQQKTAGEKGGDDQMPNIAQSGVDTHGLHGAAAEAKKGHLMGAAAEAKKGHLMGAAAENVKGNLQGAAAKAHEQKLQREALLTRSAAENAKGNLQEALERAHDHKVNKEGENGECVTSQDHDQLALDITQSSQGNLQGPAALTHEQKMQRSLGQQKIEESVPKRENAKELSDEPVPRKQAKYDEFNLNNAPSDVSAH